MAKLQELIVSGITRLVGDAFSVTQDSSDSSDKVATTAFVKSIVTNYKGDEYIHTFGDDTAKNTIIDFGASFSYPYGIKALRIDLDGAVLYPGYSFEEVAPETGNISHKIKILFDAEKDSILHLWTPPIIEQ